jgi:nucleotide-binding universal stress UspA family protein
MRILFATDGFRPARAGEEMIVGLFDRAKVQIEVFSVEPDPVVIRPTMDGYLDLTRSDMPVLGAEAVAREAADRLAKEGFTTTFDAANGDPVDEILSAAEKGAFDLIVLGASHDSWLGNTLLGSVSTHVLHGARRPVLVAHRPPSGRARILFGVDGSAGAASAIEFATNILDAARCTTEVAMVVHHPIAAAYPVGFPTPVSYSGNSERERIEAARRLIQRAGRPLKDAGFAVDEAVLVGGITSQLLKEAENIGADLVVVGSRGLGTMRRTLMGSTSEQMARHAPAGLVSRPRDP